MMAVPLRSRGTSSKRPPLSTLNLIGLPSPADRTLVELGISFRPSAYTASRSRAGVRELAESAGSVGMPRRDDRSNVMS